MDAINFIPTINKPKKPKLTVYDFMDITEILDLINNILDKSNIPEGDENYDNAFTDIILLFRNLKEELQSFLVNLSSNICKLRESVKNIIYKPRAELNLYFYDIENEHLEEIQEIFTEINDETRLNSLHTLYHKMIKAELEIMDFIDSTLLTHRIVELQKILMNCYFIMYKPILELIITSEFTKKFIINVVPIDDVFDINPEINKWAPNSQLNIHLNSENSYQYRPKLKVNFIDTKVIKTCNVKFKTYLRSLLI